MGSDGAREADQNNVRFSGDWDTTRAVCTMIGGELANRWGDVRPIDSHGPGLSLNNVSPSQTIRAQSQRF